MVAFLVLAAALAPAPTWKALAPGVEYATAGEGPLHLVRIDPRRAQLEAVMASAGDGKPRAAAEWCRLRRLAVAINLGMYRTDKRTNVGHAHAPGHVNNGAWNDKYNSVLAFGPTRPGLAPAVFVDLDAPGARQTLAGYGTVVQNLRLIKAPGTSVWAAQERRWSEAAVAFDRGGHVIFAFCRRAYTMRDFNERLLALPLGITAAMHVEGGPEASLSIHAGGVDLDLLGSYESGFNENDAERTQWEIPNVLGVRKR
jgi:hypothetical protein